MGTSRFEAALVVALGVHAGLALSFAVAPPSSPGGPHLQPEVVEELELGEESPVPVEPPQPLVPGAEAVVAPVSHSPAAPRGHRFVDNSGPSSELAPSSALTMASPATAASVRPSAPVDLGLGSYWKTVARADEGPGAKVDSLGTSLDDGMRAEVREHDRASGLGSDGPIVSAAHEAASPAIAPDTGDAVFDVECDASGGGMTARVVSAGGNLAEWNAVARELVRQMGAKRIRVPKGARGLRTRIQIIAERTLPAGSRPPPPTAGAVPDNVPGGEKACVGSGWQLKCTKGMPGITSTLGDVSNIAAKLSRIVRVHVLGEAAL